MCLLAVAWRLRDDLPLVVAANRDEFHERPTRAAHRWEDAPHVAGGKDLLKGGTWLGVTDRGRFAALTNVRDPLARGEGRSRGEIPRAVLVSERPLLDLLNEIVADAGAYPSFNLIAGDRDGLFYVNETGEAPRALAPGLHLLSNARLGVPWPKVDRLGAAVTRAVSIAPSPVDVPALFTALRDEEGAPDEALPKTGVPLELERVLASPFVVGPVYGTRSSTVVLCARSGEVTLEERTFGPSGVPDQTTALSLLGPDGLR